MSGGGGSGEREIDCHRWRDRERAKDGGDRECW
jgi:hypothetical protein